jgi:transcriptional regulator with XRE-family HTH domain
MDDRRPDIGARLRQAREQRGLTLPDIAYTTKISMRALKAIERNDFDQLPGGIFTRAYIRAFAQEVGLDPSIANEYRPAAEEESAERAARREQSREVDVPWAQRLLSPALSVALLAGAGLLWVNTDVRPPPRNVDATAPIAHLDAGSAGPAAMLSARPLDFAPTFSPAAALASPPLRIEMRASEPCWVEAMSDEALVIYRLMQPGERAVVDADASITLRVGAPEAFEYLINGAPGRPLGPPGKAVTIRITQENYEALLAEGL